MKVLPTGSILLLAHEHLGIDLAPGLSIKLHAPYVPDVLNIEAEQSYLKLARQEFGGQISTHVRCDISSGAVISIRRCIQGPARYRGQQQNRRQVS